MNSINVLSLFDGISCGQVALNRAGIQVKNYFASEIDKNAIKVTQHNFPNTKQIGDVLDVKASTLPKIDLIMGGSPCQGFSFSSRNRLNLDDPRSKLFFEFVRLVKEAKPRYFLLENVKMKKSFQDIITNELGVEPVEMDSRYFSAQSRRRLYWTNIPFDYNKKREKEREDAGRGIFLKDIMSPYYGEEPIPDQEIHKQVSGLLSTSMYHKTFKWKRDTKGRVLVMRPDELKIQRIGRIGEGRHKSEIITVSSHPHVFDGKDIRKVNPLEAERLQTMPDDYTKVEGMSDGMRYKMLGNGWTADVLSHIFGGIGK